MKKRFVKETRKFHGATQTAAKLQAEAVEATVNQIVEEMAARLEGHKPGFVIAVLHGVTQVVARWMATRAGVAKSLGSLGRASADIAPAYTPPGTRPSAKADAAAAYRNAA